MTPDPGAGPLHGTLQAGTSRRRLQLFLVLLALAGLLLRLYMAVVYLPGWVEQAGTVTSPDAYELLASSLVERGTLGYGPDGIERTTVRGPGYPLWLAAGMLMGGDDIRWLGVWSGLPGLTAGLLLAAFLWRRLGAVAGATAGIIATVHPLAVAVSSRLMADDFYAATGVTALLCVLKAVETTQIRDALLWSGASTLPLSIHMHALPRPSGGVVNPVEPPGAPPALRALDPLVQLLAG
jgi:hypothetical protein